MNKLDLEQEKNAVDLVTNSMFSLCFLESISDFIFSPQREKLSVGQFFDQWQKKSGAKDVKIPYSLGAILGYLYCGILFAKENWFDLLSDENLAEADPKWGISGAACTAPMEPAPSLKYTVRRIRNALGHGNVNVNVPETIRKSDYMTHVTLDLHDKSMGDSSDTFDITLNLGQLYNFVKAFQSVIHQHVRSKMAESNSSDE